MEKSERKRMEEALKESGGYLSTILRSIRDAVIATDTKGNISFLNPVAESLTGWKQEEAIEQPIEKVFNIINEETRKPVENPVSRVLPEGVVVGLANFTLLISKDGKEIPIAGSAAPIKDKKGNILDVVLIFRDITERWRMEEKLLKSEEKLSKMFESTTDGISIIDSKGMIIDANKAQIRMFGYSQKEEIIGQNVLDSITEKDKAKAIKNMRNIFKENATFPSEYKVKDKDGRIFDVELTSTLLRDSDGKPIGFVSVMRDITERKKAEEEISNLARFPSENPNPILRVTKESIIYLNKASESIFSIKEGDPLPELFQDAVIEAININTLKGIEIELNNRIYTIEITPIKEEGYANLYARDITERKKMEQKLKESEEKYRFLFETSPLPIFIIDRKGKFRDLNPIAETIYQYTRKELIGRNFMGIKWFLPESMPIVVETFKTLINGKIPDPLEIQQRRKDGIYIWVYALFSFINVGGEELIQVIVEDISNIKEAELKLIKSKEKYSNLINNISDAIFKIDLNGFIKYISPQSYEIIGYVPEELIGTNFFKKVHPDDLLRLVNASREVVESKKEINADFKYQHRNGHYIHLSAKGRLVTKNGKEEITGIITDITKKKKMELKLGESEKKYRGILENIEEGYFETDLQGNLIFFNDSFLDLLGYSREELLGQSYRKYMDEQAARHAFKGFNYVYKTENSLNDLQFEVIRKDGEKRVHQTSVNLIHDSRGKIIGYRGIVRDITKKKKAEELEQKFKEQLEDEVQIRTKELKIALEQQKLYLDQILQSSRFKDKFLATMSHELRTPLNAIIGFTDLLLEGAYGPLNKDQLEFVKDIKSSADHQFELVKDILDISKIESGQMSLHLKKFSINNLIEQIKSTLKPDYSKKDLKFDIKGLKYDKLIIADPIKLKEILINLLDNAVKYTIEGKITFIFKEDKENWIFKVKDTGIGIDKKDFDIIFKEFKRVDSEYVGSLPGTGLRLSLTQRLVALHGGTISFTSKLGVGSTFIFTIPKSLRIPTAKRLNEFLEFL